LNADGANFSAFGVAGAVDTVNQAITVSTQLMVVDELE